MSVPVIPYIYLLIILWIPINQNKNTVKNAILFPRTAKHFFHYAFQQAFGPLETPARYDRVISKEKTYFSSPAFFHNLFYKKIYVWIFSEKITPVFFIYIVPDNNCGWIKDHVVNTFCKSHIAYMGRTENYIVYLCLDI